VIVPSIDLMSGRAVQLRRGRDFALDGGDPFERLDQFAVVGEVAVVDLDAALGRGSNAPLVRELVRHAPCRVGGGIRSLEAAVAWLDAGARRVMLGTAASPELCARLPRERVIAAVDAVAGAVVVDGWRTHTGRDVVDTVRALAPHVGGFLVTQVEHEGLLRGFDVELVRRVVEAAGGARVTAAGGITTAEDVARLDALGADAQVGMALYTGRLSLGDAVWAPLRGADDPDTLWPTVVCDEDGAALGLVWSNRESVRRAVEERSGIYWSRSRNAIWVKGETSGNRQRLLRVDPDCDRDALRFVVRQEGSGFCHTGTRSCWGTDFAVATLARTLHERRRAPPADSGTARLYRDPALLGAKLREEAEELARAASAGAAVHEAADVLYFTLTTLARHGASWEEVVRELERRSLRVTRRPLATKPDGGGVA
jgi:phosphoribosyl-ATP pyrophosphohydrolase